MENIERLPLLPNWYPRVELQHQRTISPERGGSQAPVLTLIHFSLARGILTADTVKASILARRPTELGNQKNH